VLGLTFLGWMTVATVLGEDGLTAWIGHPQRHFGLLAWVVCAAGFVVGTSLDRTGRTALGWAACASSALLGVGALVELVGIDIAGASFPGARTGGFLGQPAYLGALGVLLVPVAVGVAAEHVGRARWLASAGAASGVFAVATSQTRGAWIALGAAAVFGLMRLRRGRGINPLLVAAAVFGAAGLVALSPLGSRAISIADPLDSLRGRVDEWHVATDVVAEHPLVGVGPEGYRLVAPAHIDADYTARYGREVVVDRAHDGVLDVAVTGGVPAAGLYLALLAVVWVRLWRAQRDTSALVVGAGIAAMAYGVQQLVLFPLAEVDPLAWLVAGVALASTVARPIGPTQAPRGARVGPVLLTLAALGCIVAGALDVSADRLMAEARRDLVAGRQVEALAAADAATGRRPDSIDTWYVAAEVAAAGASLIDVDLALDRVEAGLDRSPRDPALLDLHERLLVSRARRSELTADREAALAAIDQRMAMDPTNPVHRELRAQLELRASTSDGRPR
jgi:O-antigen ligase